MRHLLILESEEMNRLKAGENITINLDGGRTIEIAVAMKRAQTPVGSRNGGESKTMTLNDRVLGVLKKGAMLRREIIHALPDINPRSVYTTVARLAVMKKVKSEKSKEMGPNGLPLLSYRITEKLGGGGGNKWRTRKNGITSASPVSSLTTAGT